MSNLYESKFAGDFFWKMLHQEDEIFFLGRYVLYQAFSSRNILSYTTKYARGLNVSMYVHCLHTYKIGDSSNICLNVLTEPHKQIVAILETLAKHQKMTWRKGL